MQSGVGRRRRQEVSDFGVAAEGALCRPQNWQPPGWWRPSHHVRSGASLCGGSKTLFKNALAWAAFLTILTILGLVLVGAQTRPQNPLWEASIGLLWEGQKMALFENRTTFFMRGTPNLVSNFDTFFKNP